MKIAKYNVRYTMQLHGGSWRHRLFTRLLLMWRWRKLRRHFDPAGLVVWSGTVDVCVDSSTCKLPDCTLREAHK